MKKINRVLVIILVLLIIFNNWPAIWANLSSSFKIRPAYAGQQEYTAGSGNFNAQVTGNHVITLVGGGGGGGGPGGSNGQGGGGGGGGGLCQVTVSLTQGNNYAYVVGATGTAGSGDGGSGGDTTFVVGGTTYYAYGGGGGLDFDNGATGGTGGGALNCDTNNTGGTGGTGDGGSGGGGSGAGTSGNGNNGTVPTGGAAVSLYGGKGGDGSILNNSPGLVGEAYGGGGGGGVGRNGTAAAGYAGYIIITWAEVAELTQNDWILYEDNDALDPTAIWGNPDLGENEALAAVPPSNDPIDPGDEIRIRMSIAVTVSQLNAGTEGFILQYGEGKDCTAISSWTDVDVAAGGGTWRFAGSSVTDNSILTSLKITASDVYGRYNRSDPSNTNPYDVPSDQDMEWDWHVQYNGSAGAATYCFRMRKDDPADLDGYNSDSYPKVDIRPSTDNLLRHGDFFTEGVERGFFWAN